MILHDVKDDSINQLQLLLKLNYNGWLSDVGFTVKVREITNYILGNND
jgi:hypothetical protein